MGKIAWKPGTMIYPVPVVMVSCGNKKLGFNIITVAWTGTICSDPAMCYISVRPERHSHGLIKKTGEFVINLTTAELAYATDWCGVKSGRDVEKFRAMKLTPDKAQKVSSPIIRQSPLNIECRVMDVRHLGSHDMFTAEVLAINADAAFINPRTGTFKLSQSMPICYLHGHYFLVGKMIGKFGFSVQKKKVNNCRKKII